MRKNGRRGDLFVIDRFYGINESDAGQTALKPGESPYMRNFRISADGKLKKRNGWRRLFAPMGVPIDALWQGQLAGKQTFLFVAAGALYSLNPEGGSCEPVGTVALGDAFLFYFGDRVYILAGGGYYGYDGVTFSEVEGYVPVIRTGTPPAGAGKAAEPLNLLTPKRRQRFSPDGTTMTYHLYEQNIDEVAYVKIGGIPTYAYTVNVQEGKVIFEAAPAAGTDTVEICWRKDSLAAAGRRARVLAMRRAMVSGSGDARVFLWGDRERKNRIVWSDRTEDGPSAEYFIEKAVCFVGSGEFAVTDIVRQYDRNIVFTEGDAWYMTWAAKTEESGTAYADFPVMPLNDVKGLRLFGGGCLIDNNPVTIMRDGVYEWASTNVRDERNARLISLRAARTLKSRKEAPCVAFDDDFSGEYWVCFPDGVCVIFNYRVDAWYVFDGIPAHKALTADGRVYFGTKDGSVCVFEDNLYTDDGEAFVSVWEMHFNGFGRTQDNKNLLRVYVGLEPEGRALYALSWQTNRDSALRSEGGDEECRRGYAYFGYDCIDYADFTYDTLYTPQTFRHRLLVKHFTYIKLILENRSVNDGCTVVTLMLEGYPVSETKE